MIDFENAEPNLQRLINLFSFVFNLNDFRDHKHSPDYILEKWNHWIGKDVKLNDSPKEIAYINKFVEYKRLWGDIAEDVKLIVYFLYVIDNDMYNCFSAFQKFNGDILKISTDKKTGLHPNLRVHLIDMLRENETIIKAYLRDINIDDILK